MTDWNQFKGDHRNTGVRREIDGPRRVEKAWSADLTGAAGSPVLDRDTVFVGTSRGNCYAFERESGRRRWVFETMAATETAPIVTRDHLYLGTAEETVYAIDPATGDQQWQSDLPAPLTTDLTLFDGELYAGHEDGLTVFEGETGQERLTHETDAPVSGSPAIAEERGQRRDRDLDRSRARIQDRGQEQREDQEHTLSQDRDRDQTQAQTPPQTRTQIWDSPRVYAATTDETVFGLETETGEQVWTAPADGAVAAGPTIADGGVYVGDTGGTLLSLDADTGQTWFTYKIDGSFTSSATVLGEEGTTFIGADDGYVHVTDTTFGRRKLRGWLFSKKGIALDGEVRASPVVAGDVLCVGDSTGSLYGLDIVDDCSHLWHFGFDGAIASTPALGDQRLYVGSDDERLSCLEWDSSTSTP